MAQINLCEPVAHLNQHNYLLSSMLSGEKEPKRQNSFLFSSSIKSSSSLDPYVDNLISKEQFLEQNRVHLTHINLMKIKRVRKDFWFEESQNRKDLNYIAQKEELMSYRKEVSKTF